MSRLRLPTTTLELTGEPIVMGVVNASPESFSDGSGVGSLDEQIALAMRQVEDGAAIVDVGGESGVTNRPAIRADDEIERVVPLVEALARRQLQVSVDTWKPTVARAVLDAGAAMINDVSGLRDPEIAEAAARAGAALVVMHTRASPKQKDFPHYENVVSDVVTYLEEKIAVAIASGLSGEQLVLDPGPDFSKTPSETVAVLRALPELHRLGRPILLAVSRKDFVGALTGRSPKHRLGGTLAAIGAGVDAGAAILRVHDVAAVVDYLRVRAALNGEVDVSPALRLAEHLKREP